MTQDHKDRISRRQFVKKTGLVAAASSALPYFGCAAGAGKPSMVAAPAVRRGVGPDKPIRFGLIGCGGRGTMASHDAIKADPKAETVPEQKFYIAQCHTYLGETEEARAVYSDLIANHAGTDWATQAKEELKKLK